MWCNILKIKVSHTLDKNIHIQTKQVLKQNGENKHLNFLLRIMATKHADYIRYQEQIESAIVNVTIKIEDNGVKLIRKGDINMNLHFVEGKDTTTLYTIPAGRIPLIVRTKNILHFVNENGGKLKIQYELHQNDEKWAHINMKLSIRR